MNTMTTSSFSVILLFIYITMLFISSIIAFFDFIFLGMLLSADSSQNAMLVGIFGYPTILFIAVMMPLRFWRPYTVGVEAIWTCITSILWFIAAGLATGVERSVPAQVVNGLSFVNAIIFAAINIIVLILALRQYRNGNILIWETRLTTIKILLPSSAAPPIQSSRPPQWQGGQASPPSSIAVSQDERLGNNGPNLG